MYKLINDNAVMRLADNAIIPFANGNTDYVEYFNWLSEGNTPEPAETTTSVVIAVTPWQIRKAINQTVGLRDAVENFILSSNNQDLKDGWEFSSSVVRNSPLVVGLALALDKSDAELDALFELASTL